MANSNKEAATATICTLRDVKGEFTKYSGSNTELAIVHIRLFKLILKKCNFSKEFWQETTKIVSELHKEFPQDHEYSQHQWVPQVNPNGFPQNGKKQAHAQTMVPELLMACFAQMQKDHKALQKMLACTSRKGEQKSHKLSSHKDSASDGSNSEYSY